MLGAAGATLRGWTSRAGCFVAAQLERLGEDIMDRYLRAAPPDGAGAAGYAEDSATTSGEEVWGTPTSGGDSPSARDPGEVSPTTTHILEVEFFHHFCSIFHQKRILRNNNVFPLRHFHTINEKIQSKNCQSFWKIEIFRNTFKHNENLSSIAKTYCNNYFFFEIYLFFAKDHPRFFFLYFFQFIKFNILKPD